MGMSWLRLGEIVEKATRQMTDVKGIKPTNANDEAFAVRAAA